jgi:hypothetical protein
MSGGLCFYNPDALSVDKEKVVGITVILRQLELTHRDALRCRKVRVLAVLYGPPGLFQLCVDCRAGLLFGPGSRSRHEET